MTQSHDEPGQAWWRTGADGRPPVEELLGPEGMAAVGGVADEALKLFVVLKDRFAMPPLSGVPSAGGGVPDASAWASLLGQGATAAMRAVAELAAGSTAGPAGGPFEDGPEHAEAGAGIAVGHAEACAYCPVCQGIALFRSVPMSTWQRLAGSIVEVADAARDFAARPPAEAAVVTVEPVAPQGDKVVSVADFLRSVEEPVDVREDR
jgi:hypothetical protein